jgi:hypothetical protein
MNTNIIVFAYNRHIHIKKVINILYKFNSRKFYFVCDGPKNSDDKKKVILVRKIIKDKKFRNCKYLFYKKNVGVRNIFKKGLDWVFKYEKKIIVIEDDIIPMPSFFSFCDKLLIKYKKNITISQIGGCNVYDKLTNDNEESYFFSKYSNIWGWATWRNRWTSYDTFFKNLKKFNDQNILKTICTNNNENKYWKKYFKLCARDKKYGSWDFAWSFTNFFYRRISIVPKINLIKNIGFDTGTGINPNKLSKLKSLNIKFPLIHPKLIEANYNFDKYCSANIYSIPSLKWRVKNRLKKLFLKNVFLNLFKIYLSKP